MALTFRRQPLDASVNKTSYTQPLFLNQLEFKGLCDNKNDIIIEQSSFADVKNVYVDENNILASRPPLKFDADGEAYIIDQWIFGNYVLRLYRLLYRVYTKNGNEVWEQISDPALYPSNQLYFNFVIRCISHNTMDGTVNGTQVFSQYHWSSKVNDIGWDFYPKVSCVQIEDKIFVWFGGVDFIDLNTTGVKQDNETYLYFEDAVKYLYFPIHKLVINGIESDVETKNFLTETYKKRYQYSAGSGINFEKLVGKQLSVSLDSEMTNTSSKHLYDITVQENQEKILIYPEGPMGSNYHIDIVDAHGVKVILRYSILLHTIEISFDGSFFLGIDTPEDIVGNPMLTRDGLWIVAFTRKGVAKCKVVSQESNDIGEEFSWIVEPYMKNVLIDGYPGYQDVIKPGRNGRIFIPKGYFQTIDNFAYVFMGSPIIDNYRYNTPYLYAEWLNGANENVWGFYPLIESEIWEDDTVITPFTDSDDINVAFRYVTPTIDNPDTGAIVSVLIGDYYRRDVSAVLTTPPMCYNFFFKHVSDNINRRVQNDDLFALVEYDGTNREIKYTNYIHKLDSNGVYPIDAESISVGDVVICTPLPLNISKTGEWSTGIQYYTGDYVTSTSRQIFRCKKDTNLIPPSGNSESEIYWEAAIDPIDGSPLYTTRKLWFRTDQTGDYAYFDWEYLFLCTRSGSRYVVTSVDGTSGNVYNGKKITLTSFGLDAVYGSDDLEKLFGPLTVYNEQGNIVAGTWASRFPTGIYVSRPSRGRSYTGGIFLPDIGNPAEVERVRRFSFSLSIEENNTTYRSQIFSLPVEKCAIEVVSPIIDTETILYKIVVAGNMIFMSGSGDNIKYKTLDIRAVVIYDYTQDTYLTNNKDIINLVIGDSEFFKILPNSETILTDRYLFIANDLLPLPVNGRLSPLIEDTDRALRNNDRLVLAMQYDNTPDVKWYEGNLHKLTADGLYLANGDIVSGSLVSFTKSATTEYEFLKGIPVTDRLGVPPFAIGGTGQNEVTGCGRYYIEKLTVKNSQFVVQSGTITTGDLIRLRAYPDLINVPATHPTSGGRSYQIFPWTYPQAPSGWTRGDAFPTTGGWTMHPPLIPTSIGVRAWHAGDDLPVGEVMLYGVVNIYKQIEPLYLNENGVWYHIDGDLWTSERKTSSVLELDEYVNATITDILDTNGNLIGRTKEVNMRKDVPDFHVTMNEHYFSFTTDDKGEHLLEVTASRRDEEKLFSDDGTDFLLYLPKRNEQKFASEITALHPLSNTEIGVFTDNEIWYITAVLDDNGITSYSKPIKSKIPAGCRKGNQVITALDGQAILFPTARGISVLAPQDFVATTEKELSYLSDVIQEKYYHFYNDPVQGSARNTNESAAIYQPQIRITSYLHWLLFYRYMDREILAFDTRTMTWWVWSTPYPIRKLSVDNRLHIIMQIDFSPIKANGTESYPTSPASLLGVSFLWTDREMRMSTSGDFPELEESVITYNDDVVENTLSGEITFVYENEFIGTREILCRASPMIDWHFTSQRLHFGQINNYKRVTGITLNLKGTEVTRAKLSTKAYRDLYHPEDSDTMEIKINDIRTFVKRFNLMHLVNFQYKIENDKSTENQTQFKLNSLSLKYEVKEKIR